MQRIHTPFVTFALFIVTTVSLWSMKPINAKPNTQNQASFLLLKQENLRLKTDVESLEEAYDLLSRRYKTLLDNYAQLEENYYQLQEAYEQKAPTNLRDFSQVKQDKNPIFIYEFRIGENGQLPWLRSNFTKGFLKPNLVNYKKESGENPNLNTLFYTLENFRSFLAAMVVQNKKPSKEVLMGITMAYQHLMAYQKSLQEVPQTEEDKENVPPLEETWSKIKALYTTLLEKSK